MKSNIYLNVHWHKILSLPTLDWAKPFLPIVEVPEHILNNLDALKVIYANSTNNYNTKRRKTKFSLEERGKQEALLTREMVSEYLNEISKQISKEAAIKLERWFHFHFFNNEAEIALREWGLVLHYSYMTPRDRKFYRKIPCPASLMLLLPELENLVKLQTANKIEEEILKAAPLVEIEEWEKEYGFVPESGMKPCFESVLLRQALDSTLIFKALRIIACKLDPKEQKEVVDWAENQFQRIYSHRPKIQQSGRLCGGKYLLSELPELDESLVLSY
ncbi:hypothetical protein [Mastigocoleus testarum]|uniref:Uncharacterized protein n=1 Tax=Mastigocoleus testarum BC008 TaxID=371196 RepID=A0A0V7ZM82_9CYAN|nr:hypothetical protein [Mastigocoleus testarum]KST65683.1 hypothetical protein BC008_22145 [Mastigocoleus testarum BC008]